MAIASGNPAPKFTLKTLTPEGLVDVSLESNFGKTTTVLLFFPLAFTGVCTQELCEVTSSLNAYTRLNADVLAISVDSPFAQAAWAKQEKITLRILSDLNKETARAYGVLLPNLLGIGDAAARAVFVVDKTGVIRHAEQTPTPHDLPNLAKVQEVLATL